MADTVLHGPTAPVLWLLRQTRAEAAAPETPVTCVVMTMEACCPGLMKPGSHVLPSEPMATPPGSTQGGLPTTVTLVTLVRTRSSGTDAVVWLISVKTKVSI